MDGDVSGERPRDRRTSESEYLRRLSLCAPKERRSGLLALMIHRGGQITPKWVIEGTTGYTYWPNLGFEVQAILISDLEYLASNDYLERQHFDRVHRCGECGSHLLNIRETCVECGSSNLEHVPVLHHFRCGYVAPIGEFENRGRGRDCPKCGHTMRNLGTDHEVVGEQVRCRGCAVTFDDPDVEAACFRCGAKTPVDKLVSSDIWGYRLTPLGQSAARAGRLFVDDDERMVEPDTQIYRRGIFMKLLRDDLLVTARYGIPCSVLTLRLVPQDATTMEQVEARALEVLNDTLRNVDQIGRHDAGGLLIKLPATAAEGAEIVRGRLRARLEEALRDMASVRLNLIRAREETGIAAEIAAAIR